MRKIHFPFHLLVVICLAFPAIPAAADHGGVGFGPWVTFDETAQNAIAAWNGEEEVLILSTEVSSSASGKLLEFLPLPSRPKSMTEGDYDCFWRMASYFESRTIDASNSDGIGFGNMYRYYYPGIQVLERVNVGPHDITVVRITGTDHFQEWVQAFARARGLPPPSIPDRLRSCVGSYVERNICYFVFDVIDIGPRPARVNPVVYTFDAPYLFYPLEVTRDTLSSNWRGHTISVFLATGARPKPNEGKSLSIGNLKGRSLEEKTPSKGLHWISGDLGRLFPEGAFLSHVMLTLDNAFDLNGLKDIVVSFLDFEDPMGVLAGQQVKRAGRWLSGLMAPLQGPSVYTLLPNVPPEHLAGQVAILIAMMVFISLVLGQLLFKLFRRLGPGLNWKRLLTETHSLAYMMAVLGLFVPYPVLKVALAIIAALGLWFLVVVPIRRRIRALRFERELRALLKAPL